jgi:hypothetical protein
MLDPTFGNQTESQLKLLSEIMSRDKNLVPLPKRTRTLCHIELGIYLISFMMELLWRDKSTLI